MSKRFTQDDQSPLATSKRTRRAILGAIAAGCLFGATAAPPALANTWPDKPIRMIIPFPPGGVSDVLGRFIANKLATAVGGNIVVENRPGAGTTIAAGQVARAAPDGYTLYFADVTTQAINATLYSKLAYNTTDDFSYIALVAAAPLAFVVPAGSPANSLQDYINLAKTRQGDQAMTYASSGTGTILHLAGETLKTKTGIELVHVPYKGSPDAVLSILSGQTTGGFSALPPALTQVKAGKLKPLAVTSLKENGALPGVTPVANLVPGFEVLLYSGILGPAGIPKDIVNRINSEVSKIVKDPETLKFYATIGADPVDMSVEQFSKRFAELTREMGDAVRQSGAPIQ